MFSVACLRSPRVSRRSKSNTTSSFFLNITGFELSFVDASESEATSLSGVRLCFPIMPPNPPDAASNGLMLEEEIEGGAPLDIEI